MIANVEKVIEWLDVNGLEHWQVSTTASDNSKIFETQDDETKEDKISRFRRIMEFCHGNRFVIVAGKNGKTGRGLFKEEFKNLPEGSRLAPGQDTISGTPQHPGLGFVAIGELDRRLAEERTRILQDVKIERLEAELKEANEELRQKDTAFTRTLEKVEPYLGTILGNTIGKMIPQAPMVGVAGLENESTDSSRTVSDENLSDEERLSLALQRWNAVEPDMIRIIETLADMAERKDNMYSMAKGMLIK